MAGNKREPGDSEPGAGPPEDGEFAGRLPRAPQRHLATGQPAVEGQARLPPEAWRRILIVDDNQNLTYVLSLGLKFRGHEVATLNDPGATLETARTFRPDVILLDIGMPGMDGYDVARRLRKETPTNGPLLIAITGYVHAEDVRRAREAGFDLHMRKPVEHEELLRVIENSPVRHPPY